MQVNSLTIIPVNAVNELPETAQSGRRTFYSFEQIVHINSYNQQHLTSCEFNNLSVGKFKIPPIGASECTAFRAIARMQRDLPQRSNEPRTLQVLMDPGAEINLIRDGFIKGKGKASALKVHAIVDQNIY